jgi:hypothetical protein
VDEAIRIDRDRYKASAAPFCDPGGAPRKAVSTLTACF